MLAALQEGRQALELHAAERASHVGHVVLEAGRHDLVIPGRCLAGEAVEGIAVDAVQAHHLHARGQRLVLGDHHAAFAGGHGLVGVEAEHGSIAGQLAHQRALPGGGQGVGGIFQHTQLVLARNGENRVHVAGQAAVVHRHDGLGARRDGGLDLARVDIERDRIAIDQHRIGAQVTDHLGGGGEGQRGRDHLVTGADAHGFQRQMQAGGGGIDGNAMHAAAQVVTKLLFEGARFRAGGDPAGTHGMGNGGDFFLADVGAGEGDEGGSIHDRGYCRRWSSHATVARRSSVRRWAGRNSMWNDIRSNSR